MVILGYFTVLKQDLFDTKDYYFLTVNFQNVEGLQLGDKVKVNGVLSGNVKRIKLSEWTVVVKLKLYNNFTLYKNYRIMIQSESALGGKFISVFPGSKEIEGVVQETIDINKNLKGQSTGDPIAMLSELLAYNRDNIDLTIKNIKEFTEAINSKGIGNTFNNLESITAKINRGQGTLGKLINDKGMHSNTDSLIKDMRDAIEDTREQAPITSFIRAALTIF